MDGIESIFCIFTCFTKKYCLLYNHNKNRLLNHIRWPIYCLSLLTHLGWRIYCHGLLTHLRRRTYCIGLLTHLRRRTYCLGLLTHLRRRTYCLGLLTHLRRRTYCLGLLTHLRRRTYCLGLNNDIIVLCFRASTDVGWYLKVIGMRRNIYKVVIFLVYLHQ